MRRLNFKYLFLSASLISIFFVLLYISTEIASPSEFDIVETAINVNNYVIQNGTRATESYYAYQNIKTNPSLDMIKEQETCKFPKIDPYERTILKFVKHPREFNCKKIQENLTYISDNGRITLNTTLMKQMEKKLHLLIQCRWKQLAKGEGETIVESEYHIFSATTIEILPDIGNIVQVECCGFKTARKHNQKLLYYNLHVVPLLPSNWTSHPPTENQLSVYMIILESMSSARFDRHMEALKEFMKSKLHTFRFQGFSKVADNTYVNVVPMFTGKRAYTQQSDMPDEFQSYISKLKSYDQVENFIWKKFVNAGYATSFIEDMPKIGAFHYNKKGFHSRDPFHFYFRPFFLRQPRLGKRSSKFCFGNIPSAELQFDISKRIFERYGETQKLFVINFHVELGHDQENDIERADDILTQHLSHLYERKLLNKTVLFVLGDHGPRFGKTRLTKNGFYEERLPYLSVTFPEWFHNKHHKIIRNIQTNRHRLITHFDVHATLLHILSGRYDVNNTTYSYPRGTSRGRSILHEVPKNRTCSSAGIPKFYCPCYGTKPISTNKSGRALEISQFLVNHINMVLKTTDGHKKCAKLRLSEIVSIDELVKPESLVTEDGSISESPGKIFIKDRSKTESLRSKATTDGWKTESLRRKVTRDGSKTKAPRNITYRIFIITNPGNGAFETLIEYNKTKNEFKVMSTISRLNKYGSNSGCVKKYQKFCYCIK